MDKNTKPENKNGNVTVEDIIISTEKVVERGVQYRRIISVKGVGTEKEVRHIPGYASGQAIWATKFGIREEQTDAVQMYKAKANVPHFVIGKGVREDLFQNAIRHIGIALSRLQEIRTRQVKEKIGIEWTGNETITVKPITIA